MFLLYIPKLVRDYALTLMCLDNMSSGRAPKWYTRLIQGGYELFH
ncbi:hypothetical protein RN50_00414 [Microbacterium foliorum]|uniref:Uncharacterized protein n=1 Tax=Microbacterium foliorum TaxID=104336 RepID=A0A0F0KYW0_9MICO|nr:hypothetical protein RN50_00414 [Microbacterium foliorum]